ncbi:MULTISPECIES: GntR family transcriptional regulator [Streptomycetaceae]|uniref:Transcriptional regulator n=1 Tax=Streptantibioticus cattleyicolor (strain ATCC 35852 / DSM 46488 / JCM 4925 / NBRC 14057 / NRRL 8057) TaxID=1003195 RepID=F8JYA9_STREN|nr:MULTISPECIES: GntR family transcriptional regulator [Streptomycetaceae]AEW95904.1 transcriptional regulator [Streptantibioticus cattleyicolor NRRL 8057 = DSM 46488]MYS60440.1 UTRA domain-containing protein [Streptomyces sp. SID5468]CCB76239.1 Transcriptional regulator [Streptantibioticus cattleyicolor NRRL 8057 = DSM 46488]
MPNVGKYAELAERLAQLIEDDYSPGQQFLTNPEIAKRYSVSGNTASRAVQALKERGLLSGKVGGKTWVRVAPVRHLRSNEMYHREKQRVRLGEEERRTWGISEDSTKMAVTEIAENSVDFAIVTPPADVAELLGLTSGQKVLRRSYRRRNHRGEGASTSVSYLPYDLVSRNPEILDPTTEPWPGGTQHQLYTVGVEVDRIEDRVTAEMPTEREVEEQDIPPGVPMIRVRKITYDTSDRVVEVTDIPFPADRIELQFVTRLERWA